MSELRPGTRVDDRYELEELIGEGGFGVVYRAKQLSTGQPVAVKFLLGDKLSSEEAKLEAKRLEREMNLIAQLKHPNVVRLIDSGLFDERSYIVLEFIDGKTLFEVTQKEGALDPHEAGDIMFQVLDALSCAHAKGVIHRDLKPQNIMLIEAGFRRNAMVLDFGIAGILKDMRGDDYVSLTASTEIRGTPAFMAPEQLKRLELTPQTDLYTWGLVFIELLSGRRAVVGANTFEVALRQADRNPIELPENIDDPQLLAILRRAVAKPLSVRYKSAEEALVDLRKWLSTRDSVPELPSHAEQEPAPAAAGSAAPAPQPNRSFPWLAIVIVLLVAGAGLALFLTRKKTEEAPTPPAQITTPACAKNSECPDNGLCVTGECRAPINDACSRVEGPLGQDDTVVIASIGPITRSGYLSREQSMRLAVKEFNAAGGLPDGRKLAYLGCDDLGEEERSVQIAKHLQGLGIKAVLGPMHSGAFIQVVSSVTRAAGMLTLSSSASSPAITTLNDDNLAWRTIPSDLLQSTALVRLIAERNVHRVVVFAQEGAYGTGLLDVVTSSLVDVSGMQVDATTYPSTNVAMAEVVADKVAEDTELVLVFGTSEVADLINAYEIAVAAKGYAPPRYLLSESGRRPEVLALVDSRPDLTSRLEVVGPNDQNGAIFDRFALRHAALFGPIDSVSKMGSAYDAAYLLLYSLGAVPTALPLTGSAIAAQLERLTVGDKMEVGPQNIGRVQQTLASGGSVDLVGTSGGLDFDLKTGDLSADILLWRLERRPDDHVAFAVHGLFADDKWTIPYHAERPDLPTVRLATTRVEGGTVTLGWDERQLEIAKLTYPKLAPEMTYGDTLRPQTVLELPALNVLSTEVSWGDWRATGVPLSIDALCPSPLPPPQDDRQPVTALGANEAAAFCEALGMRLPTDQEFEFLMRGVEGRRFGFSGEMSGARLEELSKQTLVAELPWNHTPEGLYDLSGGAAEWVTCQPGALKACSDGFMPMGGSAASGEFWMQAGVAEMLKSEGGAACHRGDHIGFRCVKGEREAKVP